MNKKYTQAETRMREFARHHCATNFKSAKQAAIDAGYSARSAEQTASRLLTTDKVQQFIAEFKRKTVKALEISQTEILRNIRDIAFNINEKSMVRLKGLDMLCRWAELYKGEENQQGAGEQWVGLQIIPPKEAGHGIPSKGVQSKGQVN